MYRRPTAPDTRIVSKLKYGVTSKKIFKGAFFNRISSPRGTRNQAAS